MKLLQKILQGKRNGPLRTKAEEAEIIAEIIKRACLCSGLTYSFLRDHTHRDSHTVITRKAIIYVLLANDHTFGTVASALNSSREIIHRQNIDAKKLYETSPQFADMCHAYAGNEESVTLLS